MGKLSKPYTFQLLFPMWPAENEGSTQDFGFSDVFVESIRASNTRKTERWQRRISKYDLIPTNHIT